MTTTPELIKALPDGEFEKLLYSDDPYKVGEAIDQSEERFAALRQSLVAGMDQETVADYEESPFLLDEAILLQMPLNQAQAIGLHCFEQAKLQDEREGKMSPDEVVFRKLDPIHRLNLGLYQINKGIRTPDGAQNLPGYINEYTERNRFRRSEGRGPHGLNDIDEVAYYGDSVLIVPLLRGQAMSADERMRMLAETANKYQTAYIGGLNTLHGTTEETWSIVEDDAV